MSIIILGKSPLRQYRWLLRSGQRGTLGRSPWAEFCIEDDDSLLDFHCQLHSTGDQTVTLTACGDAPVHQADNWQANSCQREELLVAVGHTQLVLSRPIISQTLKATTPLAVKGSASSDQVLDLRPSAELLREIGLSALALNLVAGHSTNRSAIEVLCRESLLEEAVRYLSAALPVGARLKWCHAQLVLADYDFTNEPSKLISLWLDDPSEALRSMISSHLDWNAKQDPRTWLMAAVGWTGGSLSSASSIHVPPTDAMIITAVITAMNLATVSCAADSFRLQVIEAGMQYLPSGPMLRV